MMLKAEHVMGIILAGGQGRRMGFVDKPLISLGAGVQGAHGAGENGNETILAHILDRLTPQTARVIINANAARELYARYGIEVVPDNVDGCLGPLSGVLTGLDWAAMNTGFTHVLTVPGDAPFIPRDLAKAMIMALNAAADAGGDNGGDNGMTLVRASSNGRAHPVIGLWPVAIRARLRDALVNDDIRKIDRFTADFPMHDVDFAGVPDPFFNINTDEDVAMAKRILAKHG